MKLWDYLPPALLAARIAQGYVNVNHHKTFPLDIYTYSKSATFDYVWDDVTCKCRGLIVNRETGDIVARPFEKFFNVGERAGLTQEQLPDPFPKITDKLDGNLIILYPWDGRWYAASKGSFHSEHADWANNWLATTHSPDRWKRFSVWPLGYTPVFEMIAEELEHHVVHYGKEASGLYLLALIDNETGEELNDVSRIQWADRNDLPAVPLQIMCITQALTDNEKNAEGYVLAWDRPGQTPVRVKVKFQEFLRLQRLVHRIGPKEILNYMRRPELQCYLDEVLDPERSHPVFIGYVKRWMSLFQADFNRVGIECNNILTGLFKTLTLTSPRKEWAEKIRQCKHPAIMFAQLDYELAALKADWTAEKNTEHRARIARLIWKQVEPMAEHEDIHGVVTQEE